MSFKASLGLKDEFLIVHSGNMGVKQGLEVILEAAHLSRADGSLQYLLVGDGAQREKLQAETRAMKLENVRFLPLLSDGRYRELLAATDVSLITQQKCVADIVFPSKVITLMASGRAIVASVSDTSEVAKVLCNSQAGLVVPAEDPSSLITALRALRDDSALLCTLARNARDFARRNWNRDVILAGMQSQLYALIASGAVRSTHRRALWKLARSRKKEITSRIKNEGEVTRHSSQIGD
jgi:colanic acid biosynthesis glycosyl transferase WcaI